MTCCKVSNRISFQDAVTYLFSSLSASCLTLTVKYHSQSDGSSLKIEKKMSHIRFTISTVQDWIKSCQLVSIIS